MVNGIFWLKMETPVKLVDKNWRDRYRFCWYRWFYDWFPPHYWFLITIICQRIQFSNVRKLCYNLFWSWKRCQDNLPNTILHNANLPNVNLPNLPFYPMPFYPMPFYPMPFYPVPNYNKYPIICLIWTIRYPPKRNPVLSNQVHLF